MEKIIEDTFNEYAEAMVQYTKALVRHQKAKMASEVAYSQALRNGEIIGKNEAERLACARELLGPLMSAEFEADLESIQAKGLLEVKKILASKVYLLVKNANSLTPDPDL
jgi:hypothetical protein